jgi:hypothetical protein
MVAFIIGFPAAWAGAWAAPMGGIAGAWGAPMGAIGAGAGPAGFGAAGALTINIVPLNLGAAAPFRLKPHFWHVLKVSSF